MARSSVTVSAQKTISPSPHADTVASCNPWKSVLWWWRLSAQLSQYPSIRSTRKRQTRTLELEDDMEWEEPEGMDLYSRRLAPLQPDETMNASLECCGEEDTQFFNHACASLWLQDGFKGAGEMWKFLSTEEKAVFTISGCGGEENLYLVNDKEANTFAKLWDDVAGFEGVHGGNQHLSFHNRWLSCSQSRKWQTYAAVWLSWRKWVVEACRRRFTVQIH